MISVARLSLGFLRPLNTVFGRLALLSVALLILVQFTAFRLVEYERGGVESVNVVRLARFAFDASRAGKSSEQDLREAFSLQFINGTDADAMMSCPNHCLPTSGPFESAIRAHMPAGALVIFSKRQNRVWLRYADSSRWIVLPVNLPTNKEEITSNITMLILAITIALIGAWQIQQPILRLARAARLFRMRTSSTPVIPEGPSEVKALINDFNDMVKELTEAEQERDVMLAGVAHDLRAPLTRIQVRAALVADAALRHGFVHDALSLSQIVTQFLDFARDAEEEATLARISVDDFCRKQYGEGDGTEESPIKLNLHGGADFRLPSIHLDRILSNLVENAFSYGKPPIVIATARKDDNFELVVSDHGEGMQEEDFERALRPFVRVDPARGGDAHCGLGLTIIRRLARRHNGDLVLSKAPAGGLQITLTFPAFTQ